MTGSGAFYIRPRSAGDGVRHPGASVAAGASVSAATTTASVHSVMDLTAEQLRASSPGSFPLLFSFGWLPLFAPVSPSGPHVNVGLCAQCRREAGHGAGHWSFAGARRCQSRICRISPVAGDRQKPEKSCGLETFSPAERIGKRAFAAIRVACCRYFPSLPGECEGGVRESDAVRFPNSLVRIGTWGGSCGCSRGECAESGRLTRLEPGSRCRCKCRSRGGLS